MRAGGRVDAAVLHPGAVEEMISWERAAVLAGRSMGEWAVRVLAGRLRR
jgi:hypothetical protein